MADQLIYSKSTNILKKLTSASSTNMIVLYEPGTVTPWDVVPTTRYYGFITDLRMKVQIKSIAESEIPQLDITSTRTERILAVRDMEWNSPRKELEIFLETSSQAQTHIATVSLLNRQPYYHVNLLPYLSDLGVFNVANDARLLARVKDAGYGLLQGTDELAVFGSVKEEVTTLPPDAKVINYCQGHSWIVHNASQQLLPSNKNRLQFTLVNRGTTTIYLNYGQEAEIGSGIALMPNGGSYEINLSNPYEGILSAISDQANGILSGIECVG
jgi:hypothetical protein